MKRFSNYQMKRFSKYIMKQFSKYIMNRFSKYQIDRFSNIELTDFQNIKGFTVGKAVVPKEIIIPLLFPSLSWLANFLPLS